MTTITINGTSRDISGLTGITLDQIEQAWSAAAKNDRERAREAFEHERDRGSSRPLRSEGPFKLRCLRRFCERYEADTGAPFAV